MNTSSPITPQRRPDLLGVGEWPRDSGLRAQLFPVRHSSLHQVISSAVDAPVQSCTLGPGQRPRQSRGAEGPAVRGHRQAGAGDKGDKGTALGEGGLEQASCGPKAREGLAPLLSDSRPWEPCFSPQNSLEGKSQFQGKPSKG